MIVFDRILNKEIRLSEIESPIILGRYIFTSDYPTIQLNDYKVKNKDFLVPCNSLKGKIEVEQEKTKLLFQENELLNDNISSLIKHTLLDVSEEREIIENLSDVKDINILLRNFDKRLEISEFELLLQKELFHIEEVCREPSYHLKREITKVNVARAKRIPVKAINHLAAHSEDWSRRRIRSVEPRQILSEIIDYDLEIYENQITTSFIDKLLIYFSHRMVNEIEVIDKFISNIEVIIESRKNINSDNKSYWYKKLNRDYEKLGKAVESIENSRIKLEKIKDFISKIQMRLFGLLKSDLYIANQKKHRLVNHTLKRTNLFDNHQHYRFINILWKKFHITEELDCSQKSEINQNIVNSYIDFVVVLICRTLLQFGYNTDFLDKNKMSLYNRNKLFPDIDLVIDDNKIIKINFDDNELSFVTIPTTKDLDLTNVEIEKNKYFFTLINQNIKNILLASPTDINSEDRISDILFKHILNYRFSNYFYKLDSQKISKFKILTNWLKQNESLTLDRGKHNKIDFWLKRKLTNKEIKELKSVINEQKQNLSPRSDIRNKQIEELNNIENQLITQNNLHFEKFEICIGCSVKNQSNITPNYEGGFKYTCNNKDCGVEYGFSNKNNTVKIFYKVPDYKQIIKNINSTKEEEILNAFGYENT